MSEWFGGGAGYFCPVPAFGFCYPAVVPGVVPNVAGIDFSLGVVTPSDTGISTPLSLAIGARIQRTGDTMSGRLLLGAGNPVSSLEAACKQYVDALALGMSPANPLNLGVSLVITRSFSGIPTGAEPVTLGVFITDTTQGGPFNGISYGLNSDVTSWGAPSNAWNPISCQLIESGVASTSGNAAPTSSGAYVRVQKLSVPRGNTVVSVAVPVGGSAVVQVGDVTNFSWTYPNGIATPVSVANTLPVKVGANIYQCTGCISATGKLYATGTTTAVSESGVAAYPGVQGWNTDSFIKGGYPAGGYAGAGTLTFASPVSFVDGAAGNAVVAQITGDPLEALTLELRDCSGLPSSLSGQPSVLEIDLSASGPDDAASRRFISCFPGFAGGAGNPFSSAGFDCALFVNPSTNNTSMNRFLWLNGAINTVGIDMSGTTFATGSYAMAVPTGAQLAWLGPGIGYTARAFAAGITGQSTVVGGVTYSYLTTNSQSIGSALIGLGITTRAPMAVSANTTLQLGQLGQAIELFSATAFTTTLPPVAGVPPGAGFPIQNTSVSVLLPIAFGQTAGVTDSAPAFSAATINLMPGESILMIGVNSAQWFAYRSGLPIKQTLALLTAMTGWTADDVGRQVMCSNARNTAGGVTETGGAGTGCPVYIKSVTAGVASWCIVGTGAVATA